MSEKNSKKAAVGIGIVCAIVAGCSFGIGGAFSQVVASHGFEVMQICFAQYGTAVILLGIVTAIKFRPTMKGKEIGQLVVIGAISAISSFSYYLAIQLLSVAAGVAIQFQYVWMAVLLQCIVERTVPRKWTIISSILIICGTLLASGFADEMIAGSIQMDPVGVLYAILCAAAYAFFIYINSRIAVDHHPIPRTFFQLIGSFIFISILLFGWNGGLNFDVVGILPWGLGMGLLMSVIPVLCIVIAASKISGGLVAILTSAELPMAVIAGLIFLGEGVTPLIVVGVIVIISAIGLAQLDERKQEPAEADIA